MKVPNISTYVTAYAGLPVAIFIGGVYQRMCECYYDEPTCTHEDGQITAHISYGEFHDLFPFWTQADWYEALMDAKEKGLLTFSTTDGEKDIIVNVTFTQELVLRMFMLRDL